MKVKVLDKEKCLKIAKIVWDDLVRDVSDEEFLFWLPDEMFGKEADAGLGEKEFFLKIFCGHTEWYVPPYFVEPI